MKKFLNWIKSPSSDFALFIILLILANIAGHNAFLRFDLTNQGSYSISQVSKQTVSTLTEPLSVKVFFSDNLPSPYNAVAQYVKDILVEYKGAANNNFSYSFIDMNKTENHNVATSYGLRQIRIQEVKNDEVGFKQAWMGLAITYGDSIEVIDSLTSSDGFEYKFTTTIAKIISTTDTLSGLSKNDSISLTLYATDELKNFRINGYAQLDNEIQKAFNTVNKKNLNRLTYTRKAPSAEEALELTEKYGLQTISWKNKDNTEGLGIFGLVIEHADTFRLIPLTIQSSFFGNAIVGLDKIETNISESLQSLLSKSTEIGYINGHEETPIFTEDGNISHFSTIISDMYTFKEINLSEEDIPSNLTSIVINGPKTAFSDTELYKIDQFLMKGGNVLLFADPFKVESSNYYQQVDYIPIETNLEKILDKYGVKLAKNYVFDENCFSVNQQQYGNLKYFWAPMLQKKYLAAKHPITKNLGYVIFLQSGSLDVSQAQENKNIKTTVLAKSSEKSWLQSKNIQLYPNMQAPIDRSIEKSENLAVLLEGKFNSAFEKNPTSQGSNNSGISANAHISQGTQKGKLFVVNTSFITSNQLIDEECSEPIAMLVRNAIDYMNGNEDLCTMRTKGLVLNTLSNTNSAFALIVKYFNQFGIAVIIAIIGLIMWRGRIIRRRNIHNRYNPNDKREIVKESKK